MCHRATTSPLPAIATAALLLCCLSRNGVDAFALSCAPRPSSISTSSSSSRSAALFSRGADGCAGWNGARARSTRARRLRAPPVLRSSEEGGYGEEEDDDDEGDDVSVHRVPVMSPFWPTGCFGKGVGVQLSIVSQYHRMELSILV